MRVVRWWNRPKVRHEGCSVASFRPVRLLLSVPPICYHINCCELRLLGLLNGLLNHILVERGKKQYLRARKIEFMERNTRGLVASSAACEYVISADQNITPRWTLADMYKVDGSSIVAWRLDVISVSP